MHTLEAHHSPLLGCYPRPADHDRFRLSATERAAFDSRGYLAPLPLLEPQEVEALRATLESLRARLDELEPALYEVEASWRARPDSVVLHLLGGWLVAPLLHDLVFHPGVTARAADALGLEALRFWHDQIFWKPAGHPGVVPWHQDYAYWTRTTPARHVTAFIALDDCEPGSGGLEVVPGSHRWPLLPRVDFGGPREQLAAHVPAALRPEFRPVPIVLRAGEMSLHHSHLVHGSGPNEGAHPRRAVVLNYFAPDTRSDTVEPLLRGVPVVPPGREIRGAHFPLVLDMRSSTQHRLDP